MRLMWIKIAFSCEKTIHLYINKLTQREKEQWEELCHWNYRHFGADHGGPDSLLPHPTLGPKNMGIAHCFEDKGYGNFVTMPNAQKTE